MLYRFRTLVALCLLPLLTTACWSYYRTNIQNNTATPLRVEFVHNRRGSAPEPVLPYGHATTDQNSSREVSELAPDQTMQIGYATAYFQTVPFDGDTLVVRDTAGGTKRITANSISDFITDTISERRGVEDGLEITYTIRLR